MESKSKYKGHSENQMIQKTSLEELKMCIDHLNFISEECDFLIKIVTHKFKEKDLRDQLLQVHESNVSLLSESIKYRNTAYNFIECIDLDCDLFYHNEQEKIRSLYRNHLKNYRKIKRKVFLGLLVEG